MGVTTVTIRKPLYGNYCYVRGSIVERAIRLGNKLRLVLPNGSVTMDPKDWKKDCKVMKKVFKFENSPMILYGNWAMLKSDKDRGIFPSIPEPKKEEEETNQPRLPL